MRLPVKGVKRRLGRVLGHRVGRAVLVAVLLLAGAGTALGMTDGSSSPDKPRVAERTGTVGPVVPAGEGLPYGPATPRPARATSRHRKRRPHRNRAEQYRRNARRQVPAAAEARFLALYRIAARRFDVNWRLLASIHRQETAFSTAPSTYRGLNAFGCCAGPMQFNVTNGPVSTWKRYRDAFRAGGRPRGYPHRTSFHPSIYDDFDAIMAAGSLLRDNGAGRSLDGGSWLAAYGYYGHDDYGVTYANTVLARAVNWNRRGFCANCEPASGLIAEYESAYGASARRDLATAKKNKKKKDKRKKDKRKKHKKKKDKPKRKGDRPRREQGGGSTDGERTPSGDASPAPKRKPAPTTTSPQATTPTPPTPPASPPPGAPAPVPSECTAVHKLTGC